MCTAATYKTKDFYFGRTLDYEFSYGDEVTITPRNFEFKFREVDDIKSHYAIIGMAFVTEDYPLYYDAINEKGLAIAGLNFVGNAHYKEKQEGKDNVAQFELIPWILSQCSNVNEARNLIEKMNAREDKYIISQIVSYHEGPERIKAEIAKYDSVIVGDMPAHERNYIIKYCFGQNIRTYSVPKISDILLRSSVELNLFDSPLLLSRNNQGLQIEQEIMKRIIDIVGSLIGIVITIPIFLIVGICIKMTDGGPVIYQQTRLTKNGKKFQIYKFRTMVQNAEADGKARLASEGDPRILPIGRVLRATRLDELPQIYNILKGDMSIVGPRPERPELAAELEKEIPEFSFRLQVKAGLTGYAQVYGKYNTTPYDKLKLDLTYIRNYSVLEDLKLIIMTPKIMLMKESTEGVKEEQQ